MIKIKKNKNKIDDCLQKKTGEINKNKNASKDRN